MEEVALLESAVDVASTLQGLFKALLQPVLSLPAGQRPLSCARLSTILQVSAQECCVSATVLYCHQYSSAFQG